MSPRRRAAWIACALALACGAAPAPDSATVPAGINDTFLDPELDVERWVGVFEGESREIFRSRGAIVAALGLAPGMAVADVGAGTGLFVGPFAEAVGPTGRVYAVDIAPRFLAHLRERAAAAGLAQVEVVEGKADGANLPDASLDLAFVCDTYHHFEAPGAMLESLRRALRPGGALVVIDFERIPGTSRDWVLEHVRAGKGTFTDEIEAAGFVLEEELRVDGLEENYVLRFRRQ